MMVKTSSMEQHKWFYRKHWKIPANLQLSIGRTSAMKFKQRKSANHNFEKNHIPASLGHDQIWALCQVANKDVSATLPTWLAFNSLISLKSSPTTCQGLPLYPSPPTDWSTLYTTLKIVQGINVEVTGERKSIVSLDLQLYSKSMQLRSKEEILKDFVFQLGELHIVFSILKVMGKCIEESGLDRLLVEAGIYGETTLQQIIGGKQMKRGVEAHTTLFLALFLVYFSDWYQQNPAYNRRFSE